MAHANDVTTAAPATRPTRIGRFSLFDEIASGGMARVYFGRMASDAGISRVVAIKRMHDHFASDPEFREMFLAEASLAARIAHPNVVSIVDVVASGREILMVMDYVRGDSLSSLLASARKRKEPVPVPIAISILTDALHGLHAAHEAKNEEGEPLEIIHRDVSPHNVLVGADGQSRIFDFGIAKALGQSQATRDGVVKGKLGYMAPERLDESARGRLDRSADVFSAGVVLWEMLAGDRLFVGDDPAETLARVITCRVPPIRERRPEVSEALAEAVHRALQADPEHRFSTALDFADALEAAAPGRASVRVVGEWVQKLAADVLAARDARVARIERTDLFDDPSADEAEDDARTDAGTAHWTVAGLPRRRDRRAIVAVALSAAVAAGVVAWVSAGSDPASGPTTSQSAGVAATDARPLARMDDTPVPAPPSVSSPTALPTATPSASTTQPQAVSARTTRPRTTAAEPSAPRPTTARPAASKDGDGYMPERP